MTRNIAEFVNSHQLCVLNKLNNTNSLKWCVPSCSFGFPPKYLKKTLNLDFYLPAKNVTQKKISLHYHWHNTFGNFVGVRTIKHMNFEIKEEWHFHVHFSKIATRGYIHFLMQIFILLNLISDKKEQLFSNLHLSPHFWTILATKIRRHRDQRWKFRNLQLPL